MMMSWPAESAAELVEPGVETPEEAASSPPASPLAEAADRGTFPPQRVSKSGQRGTEYVQNAPNSLSAPVLTAKLP